MGFIYVITNNKNGKQYIGQTTKTIKERYQKHLKNAKNLAYTYPLYSAMRKYGVDNFSVKELEECLDIELNEKEKYWIEKLNTYENGYNATCGGDGYNIYSQEEIAQIQEWWNEGKTAGEIKTLTKRCKNSISHVLKHYCQVSQREILSRGQQKRDPQTRKNMLSPEARKKSQDSQKKWVQMIDVQTNLPLKKFFGLKEAVSFLQQEGYLTANTAGISKACNKKRKTYYGYKWEYL